MSNDRERVYFPLDPTDWHGRPNEGLWAEPLKGATPATAYRLRNSPFFVRGVSFLDTVRVASRSGGPGLGIRWGDRPQRAFNIYAFGFAELLRVRRVLAKIEKTGLHIRKQNYAN
jgi:hypothetical protein